MSSTGSSDDHSGLHRVNTSSQHDPLPKVEASRPPGVIGDESAGSSTPQAKTLPSTVKQGLTPHPTSRQLATALYHWTTCIFISVLILSQFLGLFWNSVTSEGGALNGSYPVAGGMREIPGDNDKLVTDRVLACVLEGPYYKPVLLNDVLGTSGSTVVPETTPPQVDGYRVLRRHGATLSDDAFATYMDTCALISTTLGMILDTCDNDLGYSVTRDGLRIVVDGEKTSGSTSDTVYLIKNALPVLVMPFWDNASIARYAVPGTDGSACLFRLTGKYIDSTLTDGFPVMLAVNRSVRESLTQEWLQASNGKWRHGWLHVGNGDESETAYFSDVISSDPGSTDGLTQREFNTLTKQELDCVNNRKECITSSVSQSWGDKMSTEEQELTMTSITIASPQHFGFFLFTSTFERTVRVMYDWETLIANVSLGMLLVRWIVVMAALHRGFLQGRSEWFVGGLGCVAGSRSFNMLPIVLLPHLKVTIASFWTAGCYFDGEQIAVRVLVHDLSRVGGVLPRLLQLAQYLRQDHASSNHRHVLRAYAGIALFTASYPRIASIFRCAVGCGWPSGNRSALG